MANSVYSSTFNTRIVTQAIIDAITDTPTYVYASDGVSDDTTPAPIVGAEETFGAAARRMIFGKRVYPENLFRMIRRKAWQLNTVYDQYESDESLVPLNFFVLATNRAVYKCLNNNKGAPSTIEPTSLDPFPVTLVDGYVWQYMFRLSSEDLNRRSTSTLIPVVEDPDVTNDAVAGSIDRVDVEAAGTNFTTIHSGGFQGILSSQLFRIDDTGSTVQGQYVNSALYITTGGGAGQVSKITNYTSNTSGKFITTADPLTGVGLNSTFEIAPHVQMVGDGTGFKARSVVVNNQISRVEVLMRGAGYTFAEASILSGTGSGAVLHPVLSPCTGHGSDVAAELQSRQLLINMDFEGDDAALPTGVTFSRFGLVRGLKERANTAVVFDDESFKGYVQINVNYINGSFARGDKITSGNGSATVIKTSGSSVTAVYNSPQYSFANNASVMSQAGVMGDINSITHPNIYKGDIEVLSVDAINTITRTTSSNETVNIILRV